MVSPPKPWERNGPAAANDPVVSPQSVPASKPSVSSPTQSSTPPSLPARPAVFSSPSMTSPYSSLPTSYGVSPYSSRFGPSFGGIGSYGSPYGGMGSYGMGYGSLGTYGGMGSYGGYGSLGYMGGGMGLHGPTGIPHDPSSNPTLTQTLESTTQHTFALLHSIVQTFGSVAQMLESTFAATHSSFFAMIGVIEQFGHLRNALGSVLGLFGLVRWLRDIFSGRTSSNQATSNGLRSEFTEFVNGRPVIPGSFSQNNAPRASKKPLLIFLLAIFGIPYAVSRLIKYIAARSPPPHLRLPGAAGPIDPSTITFARALYPFTPSSPAELALKENEIVAIMGKLDAATGTEVDPRMEVESDWWKGRTREGREGWFPRKWVEVLEKKAPKKFDQE